MSTVIRHPKGDRPRPEMKPCIVITCHDFITKFGIPCVQSVVDRTPTPRLILVYDNESTHPKRDLLRTTWEGVEGVQFIRVDDQKTGGGLTGTWNDGVLRAIREGCDRIVFLNHDTVVDDTWTNLLEAIVDDEAVYGPMSNRPGSPAVHKIQFSESGSAGSGFRNAPILNGFCFGLTLGGLKSKWHTFHFDRPLMFDPTKPFGGNETEFQRRFFRMTGKHRAVVVESCWVNHWKNHAWTKKGGKRYEDEF